MASVTWLSRYAIELVDEPCVIISIGDPNETIPNFKNPIDVLRLEFHDIVTPIDGYRHFNESDAFKVIQFNNRYRDVDLFVHCSAGISRSCAVSVFLADNVERKLNMEHPMCSGNTSLLNPWVYQQLRQKYTTLRNRSFERNKPTSKGGYLKPYVVLRSIDK